MPFTLPMQDLPAFEQDIVLENVPYKFSFHYNTRGRFWVISILNRARQPLLSGVKLVIGHPLTAQYIAREIPRGLFVVLDTNAQTENDRIERGDFTSGRNLVLSYMTEAEYAAI